MKRAEVFSFVGILEYTTVKSTLGAMSGSSFRFLVLPVVFVW